MTAISSASASQAHHAHFRGPEGSSKGAGAATKPAVPAAASQSVSAGQAAAGKVNLKA